MSEQQLFNPEVAVNKQVLEEIAQFVVIKPTHFDSSHDKFPARAQIWICGDMLLRTRGQIECI